MRGAEASAPCVFEVTGCLARGCSFIWLCLDKKYNKTVGAALRRPPGPDGTNLLHFMRARSGGVYAATCHIAGLRGAVPKILTDY